MTVIIKKDGSNLLAKKIVAKKAIASVTKETPDGVVAQHSEVVGEHLFAEPMCNIGVSAGATMPVVAYGNVKIGVSLNMPCVEEELDETFAVAKAWVDAKMELLTNEVNEEYGDKSSG